MYSGILRIWLFYFSMDNNVPKILRISMDHKVLTKIKDMALVEINSVLFHIVHTPIQAK